MPIVTKRKLFSTGSSVVMTLPFQFVDWVRQALNIPEDANISDYNVEIELFADDTYFIGKLKGFDVKDKEVNTVLANLKRRSRKVN